MNIELSIDNIILHGVSADRDMVTSAVERELARLLAERGLPSGLGEGDATLGVSPPVVRVPAGLRPDAIGARVAEAIYASVVGEASADKE